MRSLILLFSILTQGIFGLSQNNILPIGSIANSESAATLCKGPSGDYYLAGYRDNSALIVRIQPNGTVVWSKMYELHSNREAISQIILTSNNMLVATGQLMNGTSYDGAFIFQIATNGTLQWSQTLDYTSSYLDLSSVSEAANGHIRASGNIKYPTKTHSYVSEFNEITGALIWDTMYARNNFGNNQDESFYHIRTHPTNNSSYISGRYQTSSGQQSYRPVLTKLKPNGTHDWNHNFFYPISTNGGRLYGSGFDFDTDSIVVSIWGKNGGTNAPFDFGFYKTDTLGVLGSNHWFSSTQNHSIRITTLIVDGNGNYVFAGRILSGSQDLILVRTTPNGIVLWSKRYGTAFTEDIGGGPTTGRLIVDGNSIITTGRTQGFSGGNDVILIKVDLNTGEPDNGICFSDLPLSQSSLPDFWMDYSLLKTDCPVTYNSSSATSTNVVFDQFGSLVENITDTIVSNDTLTLCPGPIDIRADWNSAFDFVWSTGNTNQIQPIATSGTYWVSVSSNGCTFARDTVHIVIGGATVDLGPDTIICDNGTLLLDATYSNATYLWQDNSTSATLQVNSSGSYSVEVNDSGCIATDTIVVNYITPIPLSLGNDTIVCGAQPFLLDATSPGVLTYLWHNNSVNSTFNVSQTGQYYVTVDNGCPSSDTINITYNPQPIIDLGADTTICDNAAVFLDATYPNATYLWQDNSTNSTFQVITAGTYFVEVLLNGCSFSDTVVINYSQPPIANLGPDTTLCQGLIVSLNVVNQGTLFLWSDGTTNSGYTVSQSETVWVEIFENGCSDSDTIDVTFLPSPIIDLGPDSDNCDLLQITLDATIPNVSYIWQDGSTNSTFNVTSSGTYWVNLDNGSCEFSDTILIELNTTPVIDLGNDTVLCEGNTLSLDASSLGANYLWQDGSQSPGYDLATPGIYWVEASNGNCTALDSIIVEFGSFPNISLGDTTICQGSSILLNVTIPDGTYEWNDGSTSPINLIQGEGIYSVDVSNSCGSISSTFSVQEIICFCEIYVPNTFTPDGDERNNSFGAITECPLYSYEMLIFNRWGEVIFESNDINNWWDATYRSLDVQNGIYSWKIKYAYAEDKDNPQEIVGHIAVLR